MIKHSLEELPYLANVMSFGFEISERQISQAA